MVVLKINSMLVLSHEEQKIVIVNQLTILVILVIIIRAIKVIFKDVWKDTVIGIEDLCKIFILDLDFKIKSEDLNYNVDNPLIIDLSLN